METKPVREEELGPAFSSAAYDVILYQFSSTVSTNLSVNKVQDGKDTSCSL